VTFTKRLDTCSVRQVMKTALPLRSLTFGPDSDGAELFFEKVRTYGSRSWLSYLKVGSRM